MFVVLYGVAAAMIAGGAYAAFTGWEFLMLERGWSMVIGGTTLATGGLVLGGLTAAAQALAKRLDALGEALRGSARAQPPVFPKRPAPSEATGPVAKPASAPQPPDREIEPKMPPKMPAREPALSAGPAPVAALGIGGIAAEAVAPAATRPPPEPDGRPRPVDLSKAAPDEERTPEEALAAYEAPEEPLAGDGVEADEAVLEEEAPSSDRPSTGAGIEEPVTGRRERGRIEAEAEALARRFAETSVPFGAGPRAAPDAEPETETETETDAEPDQETDDAVERLAAAAAEPPPPREPSHALEEATAEAAPADAPLPQDAETGLDPEEAADAPPEPPVVVGTHESGANRYVMYSDGSIEAETPDGRLLFASIDELKGYVASGGEDPSGTTQTGPR